MSLEPDYKFKCTGKGQITNGYANSKDVTYFTYCIVHEDRKSLHDVHIVNVLVATKI